MLLAYYCNFIFPLYNCHFIFLSFCFILYYYPAKAFARDYVNTGVGFSGESRIFARGVRQLVPLECPKPLYALSPSDP